MKKMKKLSREKRAVSSLFIAIFTTLLAVVLISTLFVGLSVSRFSLTESLRIEQERRQESVKLQGPNGMELLPDQATVKSLRVQNNGAISVRIRALYIGQKFICDPSQAQDTYILPGKEKWIDLSFENPNLPIILNDYYLDSLWTITTERGTKSSEIGAELQFGKPGENTVPEFYIGPFMIFFDMFNWKTLDGEWESGWAIPKTVDEVTWRILVRNVDQRSITLKDTSFFNLIGNTNIPNSRGEWYIDSDVTRRSFESGQYHYIHFDLDKNGNPQDMGNFQEWTSCINFLVLTGIYEDGTPFGQTIPFEAVVVTPKPIITISADPAIVMPGHESTINAKLTDSGGTAIPNARVIFSTDLGFVTNFGITNLDGTVTVTFVAGTETGRATITATSQGTSASTNVRISG